MSTTLALSRSQIQKDREEGISFEELLKSVDAFHKNLRKNPTEYQAFLNSTNQILAHPEMYE